MNHEVGSETLFMLRWEGVGAKRGKLFLTKNEKLCIDNVVETENKEGEYSLYNVSLHSCDSAPANPPESFHPYFSFSLRSRPVSRCFYKPPRLDSCRTDCIAFSSRYLQAQISRGSRSLLSKAGVPATLLNRLRRRCPGLPLCHEGEWRKAPSSNQPPASISEPAESGVQLPSFPSNPSCSLTPFAIHNAWATAQPIQPSARHQIHVSLSVRLPSSPDAEARAHAASDICHFIIKALGGPMPNVDFAVVK